MIHSQKQIHQKSQTFSHPGHSDPHNQTARDKTLLVSVKALAVGCGTARAGVAEGAQR
jgi:hypothetical protein